MNGLVQRTEGPLVGIAHAAIGPADPESGVGDSALAPRGPRQRQSAFFSAGSAVVCDAKGLPPGSVENGSRSGTPLDGASPPPQPVMPLSAKVHALLRSLVGSVGGLMAAVLVGLLLLTTTPALALAAPSPGESLFAQHCSGCHINGGNIIRRGKTLKLAALQRQGIEGPAAIAAIAAGGIGQMGGYGPVLGDGGPEAVATYVWHQALAGWPRG